MLPWQVSPSMGLPVPLPDVLSLTKTPEPHIPFEQRGGVVQVGVGMGCATLAPVITGRIGPKNKNYS